MTAAMGNATPGLAGGVIRGSGAPATPPPPARGAVHSAEIEYAMGNLAGNKVFEWTPDDQKVSATMQEYFANFVKTGNPNGPGLAEVAAGERRRRRAVSADRRRDQGGDGAASWAVSAAGPAEQEVGDTCVNVSRLLPNGQRQVEDATVPSSRAEFSGHLSCSRGARVMITRAA